MGQWDNGTISECLKDGKPSGERIYKEKVSDYSFILLFFYFSIRQEYKYCIGYCSQPPCSDGDMETMLFMYRSITQICHNVTMS
jgi:hypothetical protein